MCEDLKGQYKEAFICAAKELNAASELLTKLQRAITRASVKRKNAAAAGLYKDVLCTSLS
jgi:hypothetical protein